MIHGRWQMEIRWGAVASEAEHVAQAPGDSQVDD